MVNKYEKRISMNSPTVHQVKKKSFNREDLQKSIDLLSKQRDLSRDQHNKLMQSIAQQEKKEADYLKQIKLGEEALASVEEELREAKAKLARRAKRKKKENAPSATNITDSVYANVSSSIFDIVTKFKKAIGLEWNSGNILGNSLHDLEAELLPEKDSSFSLDSTLSDLKKMEIELEQMKIPIETIELSLELLEQKVIATSSKEEVQDGFSILTSFVNNIEDVRDSKNLKELLKSNYKKFGTAYNAYVELLNSLSDTKIAIADEILESRLQMRKISKLERMLSSLSSDVRDFLETQAQTDGNNQPIPDTENVKNFQSPARYGQKSPAHFNIHSARSYTPGRINIRSPKVQSPVMTVQTGYTNPAVPPSSPSQKALSASKKDRRRTERNKKNRKTFRR